MSMKDFIQSKWVNDQGKITNWPEFAKEQGWIIELEEGKMYLPAALRDRGGLLKPKAIYTDDKPLSSDDDPDMADMAILLDKYGNYWFRRARIKDDQVIITHWHWPYGETAVPLDHFKAIERVSAVHLE